MLTVRIHKAQARLVPEGLGQGIQSVVTVDATVWAGQLEMPVSVPLNENEKAIWNSLNDAVSKRLARLAETIKS